MDEPMFFDSLKYVSRGGLKITHAIQQFDVPVKGKICIDVGASTGGFTDVLLKNGAALVYAVDVGHSQLDSSLREDIRVVVMERVNARSLTPDMFPVKPELAVIDCSFISLTLVLPAVFGVLADRGRAVALVKPQFEAGRGKVGKRGIIKDPAVHAEVLKTIVDFITRSGWSLGGIIKSPIAGSGGNTEFLADIRAC
jgi:23S rRNA (cytidine1920-2'-O)/16S rRNA (cytidine1409-2'-O)-methyltransferase